MTTTKKEVRKSTEFAMNFLCKRNVLSDYDCSQERWAFMLMEFQDYKGDDALEALAGFYIWCLDELKDDEVKQERALSTTFSHDLGGRADKWMEPRSSNYRKFWLEEGAKRGWF